MLAINHPWWVSMLFLLNEFAGCKYIVLYEYLLETSPMSILQALTRVSQK